MGHDGLSLVSDCSADGLFARHMLEPATAITQAAFLPDAITQVVELRTPGIASTHDLELGDHWAVDRPGTLDALVVDDAADGDHFFDAFALAADEHPLKHLNPLLVALDNTGVYIDRIANTQGGHICFQLVFVDAFKNSLCAHGFNPRNNTAKQGFAYQIQVCPRLTDWAYGFWSLWHCSRRCIEYRQPSRCLPESICYRLSGHSSTVAR